MKFGDLVIRHDSDKPAHWLVLSVSETGQEHQVGRPATSRQGAFQLAREHLIEGCSVYLVIDGRSERVNL